MSSKKKVEKKESIYKYIHCDVYKHGVVVFIGNCDDLRRLVNRVYKDSQVKDLVECVNKYCTDENYVSNSISARCYNSDSGQFIVHLPSFSFTYNPTEISNLSHELLHATFLMLDYIGVEYAYNGNNETYTYLNEFLLREALTKKGYKKV